MNIHPLGLRFLAASVLGISVSTAQSWPMFQANPSHDGSIANVIRSDSIALRWRRQISPYALNPVTAAAGAVFVSGTEKKLWRVDAGDGSTTWSKDFSSSYSVNPPSYDGGRVYVQTCNHSADTYLRCYDAVSGAVWYRAPHGAQWDRYLAPTIFDGKVYVNGGTLGGMYGFDGSSGQEMWFFQLAQAEEWTPAVDADYCYAYVGATISVVSRLTGQLAFSFRDTNSNSSYSLNLAPVLGGLDDLIIVNGQRLARFDLRNRRSVFDTSNNFTGAPAVDAETIFAIAGGELQARSQLDGHLLWSWRPSGENLSSNVIATGAHIVVASIWTVYVVDRDTHQRVFQYAAGGQLAIADNAIYVAGNDGWLTSLGFQQLPNPTRADPARVHYDMLPATVSIEGAGFTEGTGLRVFLGGVEATGVVVHGDGLLECQPPALGHGVFDIRVENSVGTRTLVGGLVYQPTLDIEGPVQIGGALSILTRVHAEDHVLVMLGVPAPPVSIGVYAGQFELATPLVIGSASYWPSDDLRLTIPIPNLPALRGVQLGVQALAVPNHPRNHPGALTNSARFTIQ